MHSRVADQVHRQYDYSNLTSQYFPRILKWRRDNMSIVRLLVLGIVKRRHVVHGYRIYRDLKDWRIETWTVVRPGSIYHAISQLERQGFMTATQKSSRQKLGPSKIEYEITAKGEQEFINLLEEALRSINLIELSVGIAFMEYLPRQRVIELLHERARAQRKVTNFLRTLPTEEIPTTPSKHPELMRAWSDSYASAAVSTKRLIKAIQSGKYVFKNEEVQK